MTMTIFGIPYIALGFYYWTMSVTPGPNNVMLTLSGVNFGFGRTMPHILGIAIGCAIQTFLLCLGLGFIFHEFPTAQHLLKWAGAAYLIYAQAHWRQTCERPFRSPAATKLVRRRDVSIHQSQGMGEGYDDSHDLHAGGHAHIGIRRGNLFRLFGREYRIVIAVGGLRRRNP
jgi:hypothetical protein